MCLEFYQPVETGRARIASESLPGDLSLFWLAERDSGRLWRNRFIRLNPRGMSASDIVSRDSAEAKESLAAWSASPDWVDWEWRGLRLCRTHRGMCEFTERWNCGRKNGFDKADVIRPTGRDREHTMRDNTISQLMRLFRPWQWF